MATEAQIIQRESAGNPFIGWTGVDLSSAPLDEFGFPIWSGAPGPKGRSHAAGLYQFEPQTWARYAGPLGIKDFSPASQKRVYDAARAAEGDAPWAASEPQREGFYGGALHVNVRPQKDDPLPPPMFLNALLAGNDPTVQEDQVGEQTASNLLDSLLAGGAGSPQSAGTPAAAAIVPPAIPRVVVPPQVTAEPIEPIPTAPIEKIGGHFLDGLLSGASTGFAERPSGAPPPGPMTPNGTIRNQPVAPAPQRDAIPLDTEVRADPGVLDRLLTQAGTVPSRETDTAISAKQQLSGNEPLIGIGAGGTLTGRLPAMAEALTPYMLGAAPAGSMSAGMRLPALRGRGGPPERIEPPPIGHNQPPEGMTIEQGEAAPAGGGKPLPTEPPAGGGTGGESSEMRTARRGALAGVEDRLDQIALDNTADRVATFKFLREGLPETYDANAKARIESWLENDHGPGTVPPTEEDLRLINEVIRPSQLRSAAMYRKLKGEGYAQDLTDEDLIEGYLHRIVVGKSADIAGGGHLDPFSRGVRNLAKRSSSMRERSADLAGKSMRQIEEETDIRYVHDPLLATLYNEMRLRQVTRNVEALDAMMPDLEAGGWASREHQPGWRQSKIPSLKNWWFAPAPKGKASIADAFDDFYSHAKVLDLGEGRLARALESANHWATASLFFDPRAHMWNRFNDFWMARGWDWGQPAAYGRVARSMLRAGRDISHLDKAYLTALRSGLSLRYGDVASRNFWDVLTRKAASELGGWEGAKDIARTIGVEPVKALFNYMQKAMWSFDDMLQLGRVYELMESKGLSMEEAIRQLKRDMPPYRIPTEVMGSRTVSRLMQDRNLMVFNHYHYAKMKQLANAVRDVVRSGDRDAAGRLFAMAVMGAIVVPVAGMALRAMTGDKNARFRQAGVTGIAASPVQAASQFVEKGWTGAQEELSRVLSSLMTPAPATEEMVEQAITGRDTFTGKRIRSEGQNPLVQGVQSAVHAARRIDPARSLDDLLTGKGRGGMPWWTAIGGTTQTEDAAARQRRGEAYGQRSGVRDWYRFLQQHGLQ